MPRSINQGRPQRKVMLRKMKMFVGIAQQIIYNLGNEVHLKIHFSRIKLSQALRARVCLSFLFFSLRTGLL